MLMTGDLNANPKHWQTQFFAFACKYCVLKIEF
jgi:hypothetical protein